jgi:L-seryl-tRNA(Ser) seleniumtransferase
MSEQADRLMPRLSGSLSSASLSIKKIAVLSQIGSGSLPIERLPSMALAIEGVDKLGEKYVVRLERLLRSSDTPIIGRFQEKALLFDLRCLQAHKEQQFVETFLSAVARLTK